MKAPIDDRVLEHINYLVDERVFNVGEMKRHVRLFVKNLFVDRPLPVSFNRRFFPSRSDLRNLIYRQRQRKLSGLLDQEEVLKLVQKYSVDMPDSLWFYRPSSTAAEGDVNNNDSRCLLLVFQMGWQQRLLLRYGQEMVFFDATYRTTRYAVPLFFVCVHTNSGYCVVATLVMEREDTASVAEGLAALKEMNPAWSPGAFMVDSSEIEMNAIASVFPGW